MRIDLRAAAKMARGATPLGALPLALASALAGCAPLPPPSCSDSILCRFFEESPPSLPVRIVTYGTSLTADGAWVAEVGAALDREYPGAVELVNAAEGARYSQWGLDNLDARVLLHEPDVVFLEFAVNDAYLPYATDVATSASNLETLIDRILTARPLAEVVIIVSHPVLGEHAAARPMLADYYAAWRDVAAREGLLLVDEEPVWAALLARSPATFDRLVPDGIHPSYEGHALVNAPLILDVIHGRTTDRDALVASVLTATAGP